MQEQRFQTPHSLITCMDKTLQILSNISSEPFDAKFNFNGKVHSKEYLPPVGVIISKNLYRSYNCLEYQCSKCCWKTRHWNTFTSEQYEKIKKENGPATTLNMILNGVGHNFYVENNNQETCRHLKEDKCSIHGLNPIHCALPLIKFKRVKRQNEEIVYITREIYTRNRFMQCPVKFGPFDKYEMDKTLQIMHRVEEMANELQINTCIEEIILQIKMDNPKVNE